MHVLFDESNSLVENDAQDEEYELGLTRKDLLFTHEKGKCPGDGSGSGANLLEGGQGLNQTGESIAEPNLEQKKPNSPRIGLETSFRTVSEPVSPSTARVKACLWTHLLYDIRRTKVRTPLIKFCLTLIQECKLDPNLKRCAFYAFSL